MTTSVPPLAVPVSDRDHQRGAAAAPVTLLEYGDYECSYCAAAQIVLDEVRRRTGDRLRFVYRHFPLATIHPRSTRAAEAAEAAHAQGRFWAMHDRLFESQDALDDHGILMSAEQVRLDLARFVRGLATGAFTSRVRQDFLGGVRSGVSGTPTFYINGFRHDGAHDAESLLGAIEQAHGAC